MSKKGDLLFKALLDIMYNNMHFIRIMYCKVCYIYLGLCCCLETNPKVLLYGLCCLILHTRKHILLPHHFIGQHMNLSYIHIQSLTFAKEFPLILVQNRMSNITFELKFKFFLKFSFLNKSL